MPFRDYGTVKIASGKIDFQSTGDKSGTSSNATWVYKGEVVGDPSGRNFSMTIFFDPSNGPKKVFTQIPDVVISLAHVQFDSANAAIRYKLEAKDVTKEKFELFFSFWNLARLHHAEFNWIAI